MEKDKFCRELGKLLSKTERFEDLICLEYDKGDDGEYVTPYWWDDASKRGYAGARIDVTADSETAIIKDVLRAIE